MFKATVNKKNFEITSAEDGFIINDQLFQWDITTISGEYFHIIRNQKSYRAELVKADYKSKSFQIKINNKLLNVEVKDKFDLLLEKMGMNNNALGKLNNIKAPMPGLIVALKVNAGDKVKTGDALVILEAMKMENIIKSPGDGEIKTISVKKGDSVEKNQVLIEFANH
jgi:biotin carboxyl carrier protein